MEFLIPEHTPKYPVKNRQHCVGVVNSNFVRVSDFLPIIVRARRLYFRYVEFLPHYEYLMFFSLEFINTFSVNSIYSCQPTAVGKHKDLSNKSF